MINTKHNIKILIVTAVVAVAGIVPLAFSGTVHAQNCNNAPTQTTGSGAPPALTVPCNTSKTDCPGGNCIIDDYVNPAIKALTATAGVIAVISLIIAGIQYSSAGGDPSKVGAAKNRIGKTIAAFLFFIFLYVFLNYIIPGGV